MRNQRQLVIGLVAVAIVGIGAAVMPTIGRAIDTACCGSGDPLSTTFASAIDQAFRVLDESNLELAEPQPRTMAYAVWAGLLPTESLRGARTHWGDWYDRGEFPLELDYDLDYQAFEAAYADAIRDYCGYAVTPTPINEIPSGAEWVTVYMRPRPGDDTAIVSWAFGKTEIIPVEQLRTQLGTQGLDLEHAPPSFVQ